MSPIGKKPRPPSHTHKRRTEGSGATARQQTQHGHLAATAIVSTTSHSHQSRGSCPRHARKHAGPDGETPGLPSLLRQPRAVSRAGHVWPPVLGRLDRACLSRLCPADSGRCVPLSRQWRRRRQWTGAFGRKKSAIRFLGAGNASPPCPRFLSGRGGGHCEQGAGTLQPASDTTRPYRAFFFFFSSFCPLSNVVKEKRRSVAVAHALLVSSASSDCT